MSVFGYAQGSKAGRLPTACSTASPSGLKLSIKSNEWKEDLRYKSVSASSRFRCFMSLI